MPVNSGWKGLLAISSSTLFAALKAAVGGFSLGCLKHALVEFLSAKYVLAF